MTIIVSNMGTSSKFMCGSKTATYWKTTQDRFDQYRTIFMIYRLKPDGINRRKNGRNLYLQTSQSGALSKQGDKGNELVDRRFIYSVGDWRRDNLAKSQKNQVGNLPSWRRSDRATQSAGMGDISRTWKPSKKWYKKTIISQHGIRRSESQIFTGSYCRMVGESRIVR